MKQIPSVRNLQNILVLPADHSVEDTVISSGCYRELKKANPHLRITVACAESSSGFLRANPHIDEVITLPQVSNPNRFELSFMRAAWRLRQKKFNLILDLSAKKDLNWRLSKHILGHEHIMDRLDHSVHSAADRYDCGYERILLNLLGIENPNVAYDLTCSSARRENVDTWLKKYHISSFIWINASSQGEDCCFHKNTLHEIVVALKELHYPVVVSLSEADTTSPETLPDLPGVYSVCVKGLADTVAWVHKAAAVITVGGTVASIAGGLKKPSLVFYEKSITNRPNYPRSLIMETESDDINQFDWWKLTTTIRELKEYL